MIVCEKCFVDEEIKSRIKSFNIKGNCSNCNHQDVNVYNTDDDEQLSELFTEFISIFTPISMVEHEFPNSESNLLETELTQNWNIFSLEVKDKVHKMLVEICKDKYIELPELFDSPIILAERFVDSELEKHSILKSYEWKGFISELIEKNRFHTHPFNEELLKKFFSFTKKKISKGDVFYRCRIAKDENGIGDDKMSAPPSILAAAGRASAKGVRCLYLSNALKTTIYETRPRVSDYVTVAHFKLKEDITVVDLKLIRNLSPFTHNLSAKEYAMNRELLKMIDEELAKPIGSNDSDLDYIPIQYITDFIKSIKDDKGTIYKGIEYSSVMQESGYNLAIFNPDLFEFVSSETYRIAKLDYSYNLIAS